MIQDLMTLEKNKLTTNFEGMNVCLYGEPGAGKTSTAVQLAGEDNCLILGFEDGFKSQETRAVHVTSYPVFLQYIEQLEKPEVREKYPVLIIDTCTRLLEMVEQYVCNIFGKQTISEIGAHGKGFPLINKYFHAALDRIKAMNYAIYYITHSKDEEIKINNEIVGRKAKPNLSERGYNLIITECDYVFYLGYSNKNIGDNIKAGDRVMITETTPLNFGKRRTELPTVMPLDVELFKEEYRKGVENKAKLGTTNEAKKSTILAHKEKDRDYKVVVAEIKEMGIKAKDKNLLKEALNIVNNGLSTDENGNQRTLEMCCQANIDALEVIHLKLKKLLA